jgi:tRNA(adenine34) deaminase
MHLELFSEQMFADLSRQNGGVNLKNRASRILLRSVQLPGWMLLAFLIMGISFGLLQARQAETGKFAQIAELEESIHSLVPDPDYPDDPYILIALQQAVAARREGSGGIGACLVRESTGEIVEVGHNRQFSPYFRSDMHAEMDLLDRYEDSIKLRKDSGINPRRADGLVLYSSVEPCPMCLTRIINTGLKKTYYAAADPEGGMVHKMDDLPPFWKEAAAGRIFAKARCSPVMEEIAKRLFQHNRKGIRN